MASSPPTTRPAAPRPARPLLPWIAFGFVVGAATPAIAAPWWAACCALALAACAPWASRRGEGGLVPRMLLALAAGAAGNAWAGDRIVEGVHTPALVGLRGGVDDVVYRGYGQGLRLHVDALVDGQRIVPPRRCFVAAKLSPSVAVGDVVEARGLLTVDRDRGRLHLRAPDLRTVRHREDGPRGWAWNAVDHLARHRPLAASLLLGSGSPPERWRFRDAGLLHLLAVSGLHLGLTLAGCALLLRAVPLPWRWRLVALAGIAVAYLAFTGFALPTQRAAAMTCALLAAWAGSRQPHPLGPVALAALALVLIDPLHARSAGFQLSLAAVLGIVTLGRDLIHLRERHLPLRPWPLDRPSWRALLACGRWSCDGLAIGTAAGLAVAPITAWWFGQVTPWGAFASLAATPCLIAVLGGGLPLLILHGLWPSGPWEGAFVLLEAAFDALLAVVGTFAEIPGALLVVPPPHPWLLLAWPLLFLPLHHVADLACRAVAVTGVLVVVTWLPGAGSW